ncbi:MAG: sodium-translocating pyrophosphatase [Thermoplasmatales archaeon]|nr:sodium-translocating pyrophosphatase [Thermoplasmatales archaeon]
MDSTLFVPIGSALALAFAGYLTIRVLKEDEGTEEMKKISMAIRKGAKAFLKRQYKTISLFFAVMVVIIAILSLSGLLTPFVPFAFLTGGFFSALCGYIGMTIATKSNARTANGAKKSLDAGLKIAFRSGAVMGLVVVGFALLDLSVWFYFLKWYYGMQGLGSEETIKNITSTMITFGLGASSVALFARVGGGIYTKAADVGADLVGKVEAGIPEDDPRNPAVIADWVGDNVGDVAGMGADLYESYAGSIIATMALATAAFYGKGLALQAVTIPMIIAVLGVICSIFGIFLVRSKGEASYAVLLKSLRKGIITSAILIAILSFFAIHFILGKEYIGIYFAVLSGLIAGVIIGLNTEYFTSANYKPTKEIASSSNTGSATVILSGMATGMLSTFLPAIVVAIATISSYFLSWKGEPAIGIYGVGLSAVGMLSTLGITLASDAYGPIADNAGGIAEFTHQKPEVRKRTDALDALGNTTAATGKGFAIGSAALTALALIAAYSDRVSEIKGGFELNLLNPKIIAGMLIGTMLPFLFCSLTLNAVGRAAGKIVEEVRAQFKKIFSENAEPDYGKCVDITTKAAQKEMILPALLAIIAPIVVGLFLGAEALAGLLLSSLLSGFMLAIFMANTGGAWDNAKKYIEDGAFGGKGSSQHKAAVIGDTVGDPLKDTSGPSLNILIKLMSMVAIVFAAFIIKFSIF